MHRNMRRASKSQPLICNVQVIVVYTLFSSKVFLAIEIFQWVLPDVQMELTLISTPHVR